ncbi:MAG TPA: DedA family protein [bacterium]|nr:DedA family protein [bacterium]
MAEWVTGMMEKGGYLAIVLLMFLENLFPPLPSELIMPFAGYTAARGDMRLWLVILAGSIGSLLGALLWYYIGRWVGLERLKVWAGRHGRWLTMGPAEVEAADAWFDARCGKAVFIGRLIPAVRTLISVPAGIAGMPRGPFLLYSGLGTLLWTTGLAYTGHALGTNYTRVAEYVDPIAHGVLGLLVVIYLYRVITFKGGERVTHGDRAATPTPGDPRRA